MEQLPLIAAGVVFAAFLPCPFENHVDILAFQLTRIGFVKVNDCFFRFDFRLAGFLVDSFKIAPGKGIVKRFSGSGGNFSAFAIENGNGFINRFP
jgi:hypothetical protein